VLQIEKNEKVRLNHPLLPVVRKPPAARSFSQTLLKLGSLAPDPIPSSNLEAIRGRSNFGLKFHLVAMKFTVRPSL